MSLCSGATCYLKIVGFFKFLFFCSFKLLVKFQLARGGVKMADEWGNPKLALSLKHS